MDKENSRNTVVFVVLMAVILIGYDLLVLGPSQRRQAAEQARVRAAAASQAPAATQAAAPVAITREQALTASPRVVIATPALKGSIALKGARIDDLYLKQYRQTLAKDSSPVELFRPEGAHQAYFAEGGWIAPNVGVPDANSMWRQTGGGVLGVGRPVTLSYDNGQGLVFTRTIAVDDRYMFTFTNTVANRSAGPVTLTPYSSIQRQGEPELSHTPIIHEGAVGSVNGMLKLIAFKDWKKQGAAADTTGGWMGVTDKYWLAAVVPGQQERVRSEFKVTHVNGADVFEADYVGPGRTLAPGAQTTEVGRVFAGAKKVDVLRDYQRALGIPRFDDAVDWGHLWFLTKPIFWVLEQFYKAVGNFGLAILLLTVMVKLLLFPLANKSFESMSKMKKLQPQMEEIKKKFANDPAKQQQETMGLYQREKINPVAGCLPILVQMPVFYALYKVLFVTLEMRHAPFFGWIKDLSAPDPTSFVNLFGILPFNPAVVPALGGVLDGPLHIGAWAILYGFSMWLSTAMSPQATTDPTQKIMLQAMPVFLTFLMARSPAGLLIYWAWSTSLSIVQQYVIMHRNKAENPIDSFFARFAGRAPAAKT